MTGRHAHADDARISLEEFLRMPEEDAYRLELVRGHVVREPRPAALHARVLMRLARLLDEHADATGRGAVYPDAGFVLPTDPPTLRGPDIAFVSRERIPEAAYSGAHWNMAPDLAAEIVSPSNSASEMQAKALDYLDAGARLVWIVDPRTRRVTVYRSRDDVRVLEADARLDGGDVLPGFRVPVAALFRL